MASVTFIPIVRECDILGVLSGAWTSGSEILSCLGQKLELTAAEQINTSALHDDLRRFVEQGVIEQQVLPDSAFRDHEQWPGAGILHLEFRLTPKGIDFKNENCDDYCGCC